MSASIEYLVLANHAEAVNGLLYISGGGWTEHHRPVGPEGPTSSHLGIAISVRVPWSEAGRPHQLAVNVESADATTQLAHIDAQLNVGQAPGLADGMDQHAVIALTADLVFPTGGEYDVVAHLDGDRDVRRWSFRVHDLPLSVSGMGERPPRRPRVEDLETE